MLPAALAADREAIARLTREAQTLASLNHANVAQIYGVVPTEGAYALVMEFVEGPTLAERLAAQPMAVEEALAIAEQIAAALDAAHERGIVHRDLKPANVKLRPDGVVKVLDFGIAKAFTATDVSRGSLTATGWVVGTPAYMSPEQARGQPVDARADVWAFGCVLHEMLTGALPALETLATPLTAAAMLASLPPSVPSAVRGTLGLCLQPDVKKRLRHMGDVRLALHGE